MDRVWLLEWLEVIWQNSIVDHVCLFLLSPKSSTTGDFSKLGQPNWRPKFSKMVPLHDQYTFLIVNMKQFMQIG